MSRRRSDQKNLWFGRRRANKRRRSGSARQGLVQWRGLATLARWGLSILMVTACLFALGSGWDALKKFPHICFGASTNFWQ